MLLFRRSWIVVTFFYLAYSSHKLIDYNMYRIQLPLCLQPPANTNTLLLYLEAYIGCLCPPVLTLRYLLLLVFKVLNGLGPPFLSEMLRPYIPNRNLRFSKKKLLIVPKCNLKTYGYRAFSHWAPTLWNALQGDIKQVELLKTFKSKLKTHLFTQL